MISIYIWNTGHEVYVTSTESVDKAREQLKYKWYQDQLKWSNPSNGLDILTNFNRARASINGAQTFFDKIAQEPDTILQEKESVIYDHSNE